MMYPLLPLLAALMTWQPAQDLMVSTLGPDADQVIDAQPTISPAPASTNGSGHAPLRAMRSGEQCPGNLNLHPGLMLDANGAACGTSGFSDENSFAKVYDLSVLAPDTPWRIDCIQSAITNSGGSIMATLNLYLDTDGSPPRGPGIDLKLIASTPAIVPYSDDLIWIQSTFSDSVCVPANSILVVEIDIPATITGFAVYAGSNDIGDQTWIRTDECSIPEYAAINTVGYAIEWLQVINGGPDDCDGEICPLCVPADCNNNGIADDFDLYDGTSADCNGNAIPDECDPMEDCNQNGVFDPCETDCNENGTPDDCDISDDPSLDCDENGIPDSCQADCNANNIPDACEILNDPALDCDGNDNIDLCDILYNDAFDLNENEILDCCEGLSTFCFARAADDRDYASWARMTYAGNPPACIGHTVTPNLIVGGVDESGNHLQEFWVASSVEGSVLWRPSEKSGPPPHRNAAMVRINYLSVLFGGRFESDIFNTTWLYQDQVWSQLATDGPAPEGRFRHAMVTTAQGALLHGGLAGSLIESAEDRDDTWLFDGIDWIQLDSIHSPGARHGHQLARDPETDLVILHGGYRIVNGRTISLDDTWAWDGTDWSLLDQGAGPGGSGFGLAFSENLDGFVALRDGNAWLFRGNLWSDLDIKPTIPADTHPGFGAIYVARNDYIEAVGGIGQPWRQFMLRTDRLAAQDCNQDGIDDATQLANGTLADCDLDGWPDICKKEPQDCNTNDVLDDCETAAAYRHTQRTNLQSWGYVTTEWPYSMWMNRFQVTAETETIDRIWFYLREDLINPMANLRVGLWLDDKGTGMPQDATLLYSTTSNPVGEVNGWQVLTFPPITIGDPGTTFFVGIEYQNSSQNEYPGSTAIRQRMNAEDHWVSVSTAPFNFENLGEENSDVAAKLTPWATVNSGTTPINEGLMFRAGVMVPGDEDGNFVPDACDIPCIGDLNGNDLVDSEDIGLLLAAWATECPKACIEDLNEDGLVDSADLGLLLGYWGPCPSGDTP